MSCQLLPCYCASPHCKTGASQTIFLVARVPAQITTPDSLSSTSHFSRLLTPSCLYILRVPIVPISTKIASCSPHPVSLFFIFVSAGPSVWSWTCYKSLLAFPFSQLCVAVLSSPRSVAVLEARKEAHQNSSSVVVLDAHFLSTRRSLPALYFSATKKETTAISPRSTACGRLAHQVNSTDSLLP